MREAINEHWGDIVGIFLVSLGVFCFTLVDKGLGTGLVSAGLLALRLRDPRRNGNGKQ